MNIDITRFSKNEYSPHMAYIMAELSKLSYNNRNDIRDKLKGYGFKNFKFMENESAQGFATTYDEYVFIVFRGAQFNTHFELRDLYNAIRFKIKHHGENYKGHGGVQENYLLLKDQVDRYMSRHKTKTLIVGGHSLGAGTASFVSLDRECIGYGFGSIRSVVPKNAYREKPFFNIINTGDLVAEYPTRLQGLTHYGQRFILDKNGKISDKRKPILSVMKALGFIGASLLAPILALVSRSFATRMIFRSHSMDDYIKRLTNAG